MHQPFSLINGMFYRSSTSSVMALPPGPYARWPKVILIGGVGSIPSHRSICVFRNVLNCFPCAPAFFPSSWSVILHLLLSYGGVCCIRKHLSCGLNGGSLWWRVLIPVICGGSTDTSRCVAEKKYTEQQAKKLFPQVFVPVCNPDGTYSEVTNNTLQDDQIFHEWFLSLLAFNLEVNLHAILIPGAVPQLHWVLLVCHPQWSTHQWLSSGQQKTSMSRSVKPRRSLNMCVCTILTCFLFYDQLDVWHFKWFL